MNDTMHIRVEDWLFSITPSRKTSYGVLGYGGRLFIFLFTEGPHKGEVWASRNTWSQGSLSDGLKYKGSEDVRYDYYERYLEHQDGPNARILSETELTKEEMDEIRTLSPGQTIRIR
jgi:hypothetical protein